MFPQAAIITHILFMVHRVDDRTSAEEQQRLEKGMREQMEHGRAIGAGSGCKEHVSQLRTCGIRNNAFDIGLHKTNRCSKNRGRGTNDRDHVQCELAGFEQGRQAAHHEHASGDHSRRMDQRGNGRWALHRVG